MTDVDGGPKQTYCTRLESALVEELPGRGDSGDGNVSAALRQVVREWVATERYPTLEFRRTQRGRIAAVRDGPAMDVVGAVLRAHDGGENALATHFGSAHPPSAWGEAVIYLEEFGTGVSEREEERRATARRLEAVARWSVDPARLLLGWRVPARVKELVGASLDTEHIGEVDEPVGAFGELLSRARSTDRVLVTMDYAAVGARRREVSGDVALLAPEHDLARPETIAAALEDWAGPAENGEAVSAWVPVSEE